MVIPGPIRPGISSTAPPQTFVLIALASYRRQSGPPEAATRNLPESALPAARSPFFDISLGRLAGAGEIGELGGLRVGCRLSLRLGVLSLDLLILAILRGLHRFSSFRVFVVSPLLLFVLGEGE